MELTLLMLWTVAILVAKCYSDAIIHQCPSGQKYVAEYSEVNITCGPCQELMKWYVDDNSGEDMKYVGECLKINCKVDNSSAFRLKVNTRNKMEFDSVLDIVDFTRNNTNFVCECHHYIYNYYPRTDGYHRLSSYSCKLLITGW